MKLKNTRHLFVLGAIVFTASAAHAGDGIWSQPNGGLWSESLNWSSGTIADGSGFGANFSTIDPTSVVAVSLDSPRALSTMVFGDTNPSTAAGWLVNDNADSFNVLTLDGAAAITVNALGAGAGAEISAGIAGSSGITKAGPGKLILSSVSNSYTGDTIVNAGTLTQVGYIRPTTNYSIATGATLEFAAASDVRLAGGTLTGTGTILKTGAGNLPFGSDSNYVPVYVNLSSGSLIHVQGGTLSGSGWGQGQWANNHSDLLVDAVATFSSVEHDARFNAVNGAGALSGGFYGAPATITVGVDGGSGTFTGTFDETYPWLGPDSALGLTKEGTGTQTFSGPVDHLGTTTVNGGRLVLSGLSDSPLYTLANGSTLEINRLTDQSKNIKNLLINGTGTLVKSGVGLLMVNRWQDEADRSYEIALASGSAIRVEGGTLRLDDYNITWNFANNHSGLYIAAGATLAANGSDVTVDVLTGGGIFTSGYYASRNLVIGIDGGSGTFSGSIQRNNIGGDFGTPRLIKKGNGTQVLNGALNFQGAYGGSALEVQGGTTDSPSTLTLSPTAPSVIGYTSGGIYFSPDGNDMTVVNQTTGTLVASELGIGQNGQGTYNFSGGTVNTGFVSLAYSGGGNNGPAIVNLSGTAHLNVNSNGDIRMGVYYGRQITINQTGGEVVQFSDAGFTRGGTGRLNFASGNQNLTWNLGGGTLSLAGMAWAASGGGAGGGNGILNLTGGILQITSATFAAPTGDANGKPVVAAKVFGDNLTPDSGARFDNYGLAVTFAAPIQHKSSVGTFDGGLRLHTSVPGGSLTLSGVNTYTGTTTVDTGNSLVLAAVGQLQFVLNGTSSNKITGAGAATLNGAFSIDRFLATTTPNTQWTLVDVASKTYGGTFSVVGFTNSTGVWTMNDGGGHTWTFTQATGVLKVTDTVTGGFASWMSGFVVGDSTPGGDPDHDSISNLMEYVLFGGDPSVSSASILPKADSSGSNMVFTFYRRNASTVDTTQTFQYGTDLSTWTNVAIPGGAGVTVTADTPSSGIDKVQVSVSKGVNTKLFSRLRVTQP